MTRTEIERLAALETLVETKFAIFQGDLKEVKSDVKLLLTRQAANAQLGSLGKYIFPAIAVVVSIAAFMKG